MDSAAAEMRRYSGLELVYPHRLRIIFTYYILQMRFGSRLLGPRAHLPLPAPACAQLLSHPESHPTAAQHSSI